MSVSSLNGAIGFATQAFSGSPASYRYTNGYTNVGATWVWHPAVDIDFGAVQDERAFPAEVNDQMVPLGGYKAMAYVAGGATINPRLQSAIGNLFQNLMGYSTTVAAAAEEFIDSYGPLTSGSSGTQAAVLNTTTSGSGSVISVSVLTGGAVTALTNNSKVTLAGPTSGSSIDLSSIVAAGAGFYHLTSTVPANAAITGATLPNITGANTRLAIGLVSATAKETIFTFDPTNKACIGWMSVRKLMPKPACGIAGATFGEEGIDCRVANFRLSVPANGIVSARIDWIGRQPNFYDNPAWTPAYESYQSVPISCVLEGGVVIPAYSASELPLTNMSVSMSNNTTQPQQEMVIGSLFPDDYITMSRAMTVTATYKWADSSMYKAIMTNSLTGLTWNPKPWFSPFWARVVAPNFTSDPNIKYSLTVFAPNVMWSVAAPPALAGGDLIMLQLQGTVMLPAITGQNYAELRLVNDVASYSYV